MSAWGLLTLEEKMRASCSLGTSCGVVGHDQGRPLRRDHTTEQPPSEEEVGDHDAVEEPPVLGAQQLVPRLAPVLSDVLAPRVFERARRVGAGLPISCALGRPRPGRGPGPGGPRP